MLANNPDLPIEDTTLLVANEYGSIISYLPIGARLLKVYCNGNQPANPLGWRDFVNAQNCQIVRHD